MAVEELLIAALGFAMLETRPVSAPMAEVQRTPT
jgi:hypothetical protein